MSPKKPFVKRSSTLLCAALFTTGAGLAGAQTATTDTETDPSTPVTTESMSTDVDVDVVESTEEMAKPVEGQITMQSDGTVLASALMGAAVYSSTDESIGEISDMIVNLDGTIEGVVVGVGGFIGIGEKAVAVEMAQLSVSMDEEDEPRLVLDATKEDLEAAPEFVSMDEQKDEADAAAARADMQSNVPAADGGVAEPLTTTPETAPESTTTTTQ